MSDLVTKESIEAAKDAAKQASKNGQTDDDFSDFEPRLPWRAFPIDALPLPAKRYAVATAKGMDVDVAQVTTPMLPVLAGCIGNTYRLRMPTDYALPSILWTCLSCPPGTLKSSSLRKAASPIYKIERDTSRDHKERMKEYEDEKSIYEEKRPQKAKDYFKDQPDSDPEKPERPQLLISNTTVEAMEEIHSKNPRGLLAVYDEMNVFLGSFDAYKRSSSDRATWMQYYGGGFTVTNRKTGSTKRIEVSHASCSITGSIQPNVLEQAIGDADFDSGFVSRLLIVEPPERRRQVSVAPASHEVIDGYAELCRRLYNAPYTGTPKEVNLSPDAWNILQDKLDRLYGIQYAEMNARVKAILGKIEGLIGRVAIVLHVCEGGTEEQGVSTSTIERAIEIADWFLYEQRRVYTKHGFLESNKSPEEKILDLMEETFKTGDFKSKSEEIYKTPNRTSEYWLKKMVEHGTVVRATRGVYVKRTM